MGIGLEAAGGLSAVQALLRQRFDDQIAAQERNQRAMESDREFGLKSQEANLRGQAFKQQSADRADALAQRVQGERDTAALKAAPSVGMGNSIDQPQYAKTFAGTAAESQFQPQMTLPATQMSGTGDPGSMQAQPAPQTPTGRQTFLGTPQQRQEAQDSSALDALASDPSTPAPVRGFLRVRKVIPKGESVPAQLFEPKPEHVGEVKETPQGFVRIGTDNSVTPITSGGAQVTGRHEDGQPHYQLQPELDPKTGAPTGRFFGYDTKTNSFHIVAGVTPAATKAAPGAAQTATETRTKSEALDTLAQLDQAIENAKSMIGPGEGRISNLEQMAGNADPRIQALGVKMKAAKMRVDHAITGSVRAGASPVLLQQWDNILANKITPEGLKGGVQAMREIIGGGSGGGTIRARDAQGVLHEAPAGTTLPTGWKLEP